MMHIIGNVLLCCGVYLMGVAVGRFQMGGRIQNWKKSMIWRSRYREHLEEQRIRNVAAAFHGLATAFRDSGADSFDRMNREIAATALAETSRQVCKPCGGCHLGKMQLQKDMYYLRYLMNSFSRNGKIDMEDMPRIFSETCCEVPRYLEGLNGELAKNQMQIDWKRRFLESRDVVVTQFREIEDFLEEMASSGEEWNDVTETYEKAIRRVLRSRRIRLGRLLVECEAGERLRIHMTLQALGGHCVPSSDLADVLSEELKRHFQAEDNGKTMIGKESCRLIFTEKPAFRVSFGAARLPGGEEEVSGDNYSAMELPGGRFLLCLSDGMGSGPSASEESEAVVGLSEQLLEAGFSMEGTVRAINSVLLLREGEQRPATLDLHCLNLYTGSLTSRKQGAAATFIKRGDQVTILESGDMPIGWSQNLTTEETKHQLEKETYMILVTDGVMEALPGTEKEEFMMEILRRMKGGNPQKMADDLLNLAAGSGTPRDDMTVLAAAIQAER